MKTFDPTKPVQTRDGRPARIVATDAKVSNRPILVLITDPGGFEGIGYRFLNGRLTPTGESIHDLVNIPVKKSGWINIYADWRYAVIYDNKEAADYTATVDRVACIPIEWEE